MPTIRKSEKDYIQEVIDKVKKKTVYEGDCWRYTGKHVGKGYASITYRNTTVRLNRFIGYVYHGLELSGNLTHKVAAHKPECRFKDCWNPEHIYVCWPKQNVADQIKAGTFHYGTNNLNGGENFNREAYLEGIRNKGKK